MTAILHIDSSARAGLSGRSPHGSHSRRLTARFVDRWRAARPADSVTYRDVGAAPPSPVTGDWIHAAFTPPERRDGRMARVLAESDRLVDELLAADLIVVGAPMYNFGPPAPLKAWIDNVVRVGRTFGFDRARTGEPYWPMLDAMGKTLVILSSRGDHGYGSGGRLAHANHLEPALRTPLSYLGVTDVHEAAIEYDEFADSRLAASIVAAEARVDELVEALLAARPEAVAA
ncbi:FMN-dependent NADH-azoreductase [Caulobacter sp. UNC279MFTsu5.1]|uniref:FMN-dependent NADH-azoreductase n=1 Tax=Caulobacter sp. UNC279MFTsu5.1 TaxID=1502775 RepID=UPI0008E35156|nr:NAD(P)H-dependent oxidoreductase [Caulobacter sp. UNC279MFTsu5.1]SFI84826.1 FMN-dependent NADH-azoreductase [Caulobacter sp. UNC279MFTsu5.1]